MPSSTRCRLAILAATTAALTAAGGIATAVGPDPDRTPPDVVAAATSEVTPAELPTPSAELPTPSAELPTPSAEPSPAPRQAAEPRATATPEPAPSSAEPPAVRTWSGTASWYGPGFAGDRTANGERFDPGALTAAHKELAFGSRVRVTFVPTGRSVVVRINDRGPFVAGREIDLSRAAAEAVGLRGSGHGPVTLELLA
jgi:rare lipoprotein A